MWSGESWGTQLGTNRTAHGFLRCSSRVKHVASITVCPRRHPISIQPSLIWNSSVWWVGVCWNGSSSIGPVAWRMKCSHMSIHISYSVPDRFKLVWGSREQRVSVCSHFLSIATATTQWYDSCTIAMVVTNACQHLCVCIMEMSD